MYKHKYNTHRPIGSMGLVYWSTFTININHVYVDLPVPNILCDIYNRILQNWKSSPRGTVSNMIATTSWNQLVTTNTILTSSVWTQRQIRDTHHNIPHQRALTLAAHGTTIAPAAIHRVSHHHVDIIMGNLWRAQGFADAIVQEKWKAPCQQIDAFVHHPKRQTHLQQSICPKNHWTLQKEEGFGCVYCRGLGSPNHQFLGPMILRVVSFSTADGRNPTNKLIFLQLCWHVFQFDSHIYI